MARLIALVITVLAIVVGVVVGIHDDVGEGFVAGGIFWVFFGGLEFAVISLTRRRSLEELRRELGKLKQDDTPSG